MNSISKYIAIVTAFLWVTGFISNYSFYSQFNIEIFDFLTTSETILFILPQTFPILISILAVISYTLLQLSMHENEVKKDIFYQDKDLSFWGPFKDLYKKKIKDNILRTFFFYLQQILSRIMILVLLFAPLYSIIINYIHKSGSLYNHPFYFFISSIVWVVIFAYAIEKLFGKFVERLQFNLGLILIILGLFCSIYLLNTFKAFRILENKPFYSLELKLMDSQSLTTNDNIVYIGKTQDFIFFRDLNNQANIIISNKDIRRILIKPIH